MINYSHTLRIPTLQKGTGNLGFDEGTRNLIPSPQLLEPPIYTREELPTCPSQVFAGNRIGDTPIPLQFWKRAPTSTSTRSSQPSTDRVRSINPLAPYTLGWPDAAAIAPQNLFEDDPSPTPSVARLPSQSRRTSRGEIDSSDEECKNCNQIARRKKGRPYVPPAAKGMYGGADPFVSPGGTRCPRTHEEVVSMVMVGFKHKIDPKAFTPFKDEARWIQWWNHFKITLGSQGMEAILDRCLRA